VRSAPLALALLFAAGCLAGPSAPETTPTQREAAIYDAIEAQIGAPVVEDHDHNDPAQHVSHHFLDRVALVTGEDGRVAPAGEGYVETAVAGGFAYLSRSGPQAGLAIFNVSDVERPKFVSSIQLNAGFEADVEVSADGRWAFWETQRVNRDPPPVPPTPDPGAELPNGIHVLDLSEKAHPRWASYTPVWPDGPHSITYARIGDLDVVFASTYAYAYAYMGEKVPLAQRLVIYELDRTLPIPYLRQVAEYRDPEGEAVDNATTGGLFPHDVSVATNPVTHRTYAYVAYWNLGVDILDVSDPATPLKVGQALDFGPAPYRNVHMAHQFRTTIDGHVVLVAEPEIGQEPDSGYITFIDATDPAHPTYISSWRMPGNLTSAGGALGPHYFDVLDGRVALSSYHAGFWVIDVHDAANLLHPRTVAQAEVATSAFDAWWADETHIVGSDAGAGLAIYRYTGPTPHQDEILS
jgi:hypothetical protein